MIPSLSFLKRRLIQHFSLTVVIALITTSSFAQNISTVAGTGTSSSTGDGSPAVIATMQTPQGVVFDKRTNSYYIAESVGNRIRKVNSAGIISTYAGTGSPGYNGDTLAATATQFNNPQCLAIDTAGNLYVTDVNNHRIRKITPSGTVSTLAGTGTASFSGDGGAATAAALNGPRGVYVDNLNNVYIADANNNRIRVIDTFHNINTIVGSGAAGFFGDGGAAITARLNYPTGVYMAPSGDMFIADANNSRIRQVDIVGLISTFAGSSSTGYSGDGGAATSAQLNVPLQVFGDVNGNIFFSDNGNDVIRKINTSGVINTIAGTGSAGYSGDGGAAVSAQLNNPTEIAIDTTGSIYIADASNHRVRKIACDRPLPPAITGSSTVCLGDTTTLSDSVTGGTWSVLTTNIVIDGTSGVVTGIALGTGTVQYSTLNICGTGIVSITRNIDVITVPNAGTITGPTGMCVGDSILLSDTVSGGSWSSASSAVSVNATTGRVRGLAIGTATISYTVTNSCGSSVAPFNVSVGAPPTVRPIVGLRNVCIGSTITLTDSVTGGFWTTSNAAIASVNSSGVVRGNSNGNAIITYTVYTSCGSIADTQLVTVSPAPNAGSITNIHQICFGSPTLYTTTGSGGTWISSNTSIATVSSSGSVIPVTTTGTFILSYTAITLCGSATDTTNVNIITTPVIGLITGPTTVCVGNTIVLSDTSTGVSWSSSNTSIATVNASGTVFGITSGSVIITCSKSNACGTSSDTALVFVIPPPSAITVSGIRSLCSGSNTTFTTTGTGGSWISSNTSIATVNSSGLVTAVGVGRSIISYSLSASCGSVVDTQEIEIITVPSMSPITGPGTVCAGNTIILSNTATGGSITWSSSAPSIATVNSSGTVTGLSAGATIITYSLTNSCGASSDTQLVAVLVAPSSVTIAGYPLVCGGTSTVYTTTGTGGTWSSSNNTIATVDTSGNVFGVSTGVAIISYSITNPCGTVRDTQAITVNPTTDTAVLTGASTVCIGNTATITSSLTGGVWQISDTSIATISSTGVVTGVSAGTATVSYINTGFCTTSAGLHTITVLPSTSAGTLSGPTLVCVASSVTFTPTVTGGSWTTSASSIATVNSSGLVSGVSSGSATITYTVSGSCGSAFTTKSINVTTVASAGSLSSSNTNICVGGTTTVTPTETGGVWSSSNISRATVDTTGRVTGVGAGSVTISYTLTGTCGVASATININVFPAPNAGTITGASSVCAGATTTLTNSIAGGVWRSGTTSVATITSSGLVTGVSAGSTIITYTVTNACGSAFDTAIITVNPAPNAGTISGSSAICQSTSSTYSSSVTGGTWTSSATSIATINSSGVLTGVNPGSTVISYSVTNSCGTAVATYNVTINPAPNAGSITGSHSVCAGSTASYTNSATGGTWSSSSPSIASVDGAGTVSGITNGTAIISYTATNSCGTAIDTQIVVVLPLPIAGTISGSSTLCTSGTSLYTTTGTGGTWSSTNTTVATINSSGVVTPLTAGTTTISYTVTNSCGTVAATKLVTVISSPDAGTISGTSPICVGSTSSFTTTGTGGTWSSANTSIATVDASGLVTGVASGSVVISYTVATSCSTAVATRSITINPLPNAGSISGTSSICTGTSTTLSTTATGGTWSSSNATIASVNTSGLVSGLSTGSSIISYTVTNSCGSASATFNISVIATPSAGTISGARSLCAAGSTLMSTTGSGGTWSSSNASIASIDASGIVSGIAAGTAIISYTVSSTCGTSIDTQLITINPLPNAGTISGTSSICAGSTTTLTTTGTGGVWSTITGNATVTSAGLVRGISTGIDTIVYTATNSCGVSRAVFAVTITPGASAGTITGPTFVCTGSTINLNATITGGTWSSSNNFIATINSSGLVRGVATGSVTISYLVSGSCGFAVATYNVAVNSSPVSGTISGARPLCVGSTLTLTTTGAGGSWSSSDASLATINSTGVVTAVSAGTVTMSYTVSSSCGTSTSTASITISNAPVAATLSGPTSVCTGNSITLTASVAGGTWSSSAASIANVTGGLVTGVTAGTVNISYTTSTACGSTTTSTPITVNPTPFAGTISGLSSACIGGTVTLTTSGTGGSWSSDNASVASIDASGNVSALTAGTATISYNVTNACGTSVTTHSFTVNGAADAGAITGAATVCTGATTTMSTSGTGGTWSTSNASIATINAAGVVTGVAAGTVTISYNVSSSCGSDLATASLVVIAAPTSGTITGSTAICLGSGSTLTPPASGGLWTSSNATIATVNAAGIVTGTGIGSATISYTQTNACGSAVSTLAVTVGAGPFVGTISGASEICVSTSTTLIDTVTGGTWSSSNPAIATVSSTGVVTGNAAGTATISYSFVASCGTASALATMRVVTFPTAGVITGPTAVCLGLPTTYVDTIAGGVWSTGDASIATISTTGVVTGLSIGTTNIYYTVTNACGVTNVTIALSVVGSTSAGFISGTTTFCEGATSVLIDTVSGGTWSSSDTSIAVVSASGAVRGVSGGSAIITYSLSTPCGLRMATAIVNINPLPSHGTISGPASICMAATGTFTETVSGGSWSIADVSIATISGTGVVTGVNAGTTTISYTVTNSCGTAYATRSVDVVSMPTTAGTISGTSEVCLGATTTLVSSETGGTWSSADTTIAQVNTAGTVTGIASGSVNISYTVSNACGSISATQLVNVLTTPTAGTLSTSTTTFCANSSIALSSSIAGGSWSSSDASIATVDASGITTGIAAGSSTITYTVTNICGSDFATLDITVRPTPVLSAISGASLICTGSSYTFSNSVSGGTWSSSDASIATIDATSGSLSALTTGTAVLTYTATNVFGCSDTETLAIAVSPAPVAGTLTASTTTVCSGSTLSITSTATGGTWSSSDVSVATVDASGVVTGVSFGSAAISYSVTNSCGTDVASVSINVNPTPTVSAITGATSLCNNSTITLSNATTGGTWSSSDASIATIDASSGDLTGVSAGTVTITYNVTNIFGCSVIATQVDTIYPSTDAGSITASTTTVCAGNVITLVDTASGGTWSSSDASIATVDATGVVTGVGAGSVTISYATSNIYGCNDLATADITVNPTTTLSPISGATSQCTGTNITLTNTTLFGTWSSSDASIASIDPTSGVVTGNADGIATITYSYTNAFGCSSAVTSVDTVHLTADAGTISASTTTICVGSDLALIDTTTGGVWSSSDASVATVSSTGMVTGLSAGTATISYFMDNAFGCTDLESVSITVNPTPDAGTLSGPSGLCVGSTSTWSSTTSGGTWSSSNTSVGTIDATSGTFDGLSAGETQLSYIVSNVFGCADTATAMDTVLSVPTIGAITGTTTICSGTTSTLSSTTTGGVWSSSDASVATVDASTGTVTGVSAGAATITYTVGTTCSAFATTVVTINATPSVSAITGTTSACVGNSSTLSNATTGGAWSSSDASIATVDASTGIVSGVAAGTATISYSVSSAGCTSHATASYTVHGLPVVGAISGDTAICLGATTTMSDTSVGGTWASSNAAVATINSTTGAVTGLSVDTVTLSYTITNGFGCSNTAYFAMSVEGLPVVSAIAGSGSICLGSSHTLTSTTTGGTWSSSDTSILAVSSTGVATGRAAGVATISYTVTSSLGCVGTATTTDTVLALPTVAAITGTPSTCLGDTSRLANTTTGGTWSSSDATIATISSTGLVTGLAAGTATITYTYTNTAGCTNTATTTFTVNALPTVSAITGSTRVCLGSSITLVDTTTGGVWSTASSTIATVSSTGVVSSVAVGATLISYTVTNSAGCSASAVVTVTVSSAPTVSAIGGPTAACLGSLITMTNATTGGVWSSSNTAVATIGMTSGSVTTLSVGTTTISYTVTSGSGCVATATSTLTIDTMAMGTLSPAADTIEICHSNNVNMNVLISGTGLSYQWFRDGVAIAGATSISYATNVPAYYTVNVSNGTCSQMISGITLINSPLPVIVTSGGGVLSVGRFASYQWYLDGVAISGATDSSYTATTPGSYTVITTTGTGCVDQSAPYVVLPGTGVGVVTDKNSIQIYPNPASSTLSISAQEVVNVVIMSADGKVVISATAATSIDVSNLADGMYMVSIYNQQHQLIKVDKFIKAN